MFQLLSIPIALLLLLGLLAGPRGALGIYQEQLQDMTWAREGLGHISHSFAIPQVGLGFLHNADSASPIYPYITLFLFIFMCICIYHQGKRMVVASSDMGVVAVLHSKSGAVQWRSVLPAGETLDRVIAGRDLVYVLSQQGMHLRALDDQSGAVRWETSLRTASSTHPSSTVQSDLVDMYLGAVGSTVTVVVLSDNCIHFIDALTGSMVDLWCVPDEKTAVIAHLSGALIGSTGEVKFGLLCSINSASVAVSVAHSPCHNVSVLSASLRQSTTRVTFSSGVIGSMAGAAAPVPIGAVRSFFPRDGVSSAMAVHSSSTAVFLSKLSADGTGEVSQDVLYSAPVGSLDFVSKVQLLRFETQPLVGYCILKHTAGPSSASSGSISNAYASVCTVVSGSHAKLVASCGNEGGQSSSIAVQYVPVYPSFDVSSIGCASVDMQGNMRVLARHEAPSTNGEVLESKVALKSQLTSEAISVLSAIGANASRFQDAMPTISSLDNVFIQVFPVHASKTTTTTTTSHSANAFSIRAFAVSSSSASVFVQSKALLWARDDGSAYTTSGFVVNRPVMDEFDSNAAFEVSGSEIPDFRRRLELQRVELRAAWHSFKHDVATTWQLYKTQWRQDGLKTLLRLFGYMSPTDSSVDNKPTSASSRMAADKDGLAMLEWLSYREALDDVGKRFGFDRYAVLLSRGSSRAVLAASAPDAKLVYIDSEELFDAREALTSFSNSVLRAIKVIALDLIHGTQVWAFQPDISPFIGFIGEHLIDAEHGDLTDRGDKVKVFAKLIHDRNVVVANSGTEGSATRHIGHLLVSIKYVKAPSAVDAKANNASTSNQHGFTKTCYYPIDLASGSFVPPATLYGPSASSSKSDGVSYDCFPDSYAHVVGALSLDTSALAQDASHYATRSNAARFLLVSTLIYVHIHIYIYVNMYIYIPVYI
jgi:hypothetical protein